MNIVKLPSLANDIPAKLRELADAIDAGNHKDLDFIVAVLVSRRPRVISTDIRAWGECAPLEAVGALLWSANNLTGVCCLD